MKTRATRIVWQYCQKMRLPLNAHLKKAHAPYERDLDAGYGEAYLPKWRVWLSRC